MSPFSLPMPVLAELTRMSPDDVQYEPQKQLLRQHSNGTLLQVIADTVFVLVCDAGERMLRDGFPGDFAEHFVDVVA
jgi:hypothetical protein